MAGEPLQILVGYDDEAVILQIQQGDQKLPLRLTLEMARNLSQTLTINADAFADVITVEATPVGDEESEWADPQGL